MSRVEFICAIKMRGLVEVLWKVPMDNVNLMPKCVQVSAYKFRRMLQGVRVRRRLYYTNGIQTWPCMLPATDQAFLYELKQMIDKVQDVEEKNPSAYFS